MRARLRRAAWLGAALVAGGVALQLGGCRVGYPFGGPGYDPGRGVVHPGAGERVLVVVTRGDIEPGGGARFAEELRRVLGTMDEHDGLVGFSVRRELFGSRVWTMSVWIDRSSVERFVRSAAHARAMVEGGILPASFIAAYDHVGCAEVPLGWREAERLLERQGE